MDSLDVLGLNLSPEVRDVAPEVVELRRRIHQHPELGFKEAETQKLVLSSLKKWGIEGRKMGRTGVVADIRGEAPGPVLLVRGDMDALPIQEQGDAPYKSRNPGIMHACGHDAHTSIVLTTARLLKARGLDRGTVRFMFQPAEEGDGGAIEMIRDGVLENPKVDGAVGFHVWSGFDVGRVAAVDGPTAASVDGFRLTITGKGAHAATPDEGIDPVTIAAQIITAAQALITRRIAPQNPVVLSFTKVAAGSAFNIIPEQAEILGTFRTLDQGIRTQLRADLAGLAASIAGVFGATAHYETTVENIPTVNDPSMAALARSVIIDKVGESNLHHFQPPLVGEDFSEVLDRVPGVFIVLGCRNETAGILYPHHHPKFDIDERVLPIGVDCALGVIDSFMKR